MMPVHRLQEIDDALVRLRRLWSPGGRLPDGATPPVDMSSVLVVEACARAGAAGAHASIGDVARFADVAHSTASRLVDRAVRAGLVTQAPAGDDARRCVVALTDAGHEVRRRSLAHRTGWLARTLDDWNAADTDALARLLTRFAAAVDAGGGPGPTAEPSRRNNRPTRR